MFRVLLSFYCIVAGLISVSAALFFGGTLWQRLSSEAELSVEAAALCIALLVSLGITGLFAHGISRARSGEVPPKLWLTCLLLGVPFMAFAVFAFLRRST
jgi:cation transporter-like permease